MGAHCDLCKPGFYNLQDGNRLGCTDCFCFGVSDVCESSTWSTAQVGDSPAHRCNKQTPSSCIPVLICLLFFQVLYADAWLFPQPAPPQTLVVHDNDLHTPANISSGHSHQHVLLWEAPESFLGNKVRQLFQMWSLFSQEGKRKLPPPV